MKVRLTCIAACAVLSMTAPANAEMTAPKSEQATEQVIEPQIDRRTVTVPHISTSDIEVGIYFGRLSIENFGASSVTGGRIAYHVTDRTFLEAAYAESTVSDEFYRERAFPVFSSVEAPLRYYSASIGYNLLPGESFLTKNWAIASAFYLIGGLGTIKIDGEKFGAMNFGFGYRMLLTDWLALHLDVRDHIFYSDLLGPSKRTDNFEMTGGITVFF